MCASCWLECDLAEVTPQVRDAAATIGPLYEQHPTGGAMHVVTDDMNTEDSSVRWVRDEWSRTHPLDEVERACLDALLPLTEDERDTAIAIWEGWHDAPAGAVVTTEHLRAWRARMGVNA